MATCCRSRNVLAEKTYSGGTRAVAASKSVRRRHPESAESDAYRGARKELRRRAAIRVWALIERTRCGGPCGRARRLRNELAFAITNKLLLRLRQYSEDKSARNRTARARPEGRSGAILQPSARRAKVRRLPRLLKSATARTSAMLSRIHSIRSSMGGGLRLRNQLLRPAAASTRLGNTQRALGLSGPPRPATQRGRADILAIEG